MKRARKPAAGAYRVIVGLNYGPDNRRAEPGDIVTDLPATSLPWLVQQGCIEPVDAAAAGGNEGEE